jgi:ornithine cyclodeaminase/alanine dehydrogenase-like protein (mu-crystallin family)
LIPLFDGNDLRPGTHVTGVGSFTPQMQEIDATTIRRARVVVDSRKACMAEAGDLIIAGADISAEIGEIVNGVSRHVKMTRKSRFLNRSAFSRLGTENICSTLKQSHMHLSS